LWRDRQHRHEAHRAYRRASRQATGKVTGFIGEFFGAVQAVKVASAEKTGHRSFSQTQRRAPPPDPERTPFQRSARFALSQHVHPEHRHHPDPGRSVDARGTFTLGDFSLFVYLLQSMGDLTTFAGMVSARYKQLDVSVQRMYRLMEGAPLEALVEHSPVDLDGPLPEVH
jgi:ATP-binding cassette, subfamily B, bacterial